MAENFADQLDFTTAVARDGYVWWYVDGMSDDRQHALTVIAFIGSVFSPYYAFARRRGRGDPEHFVALNVALYGQGGKRWSMTERGQSALDRDRKTLRIGPSGLRLDGDTLVIQIDETGVPIPYSLRGEVRIRPLALTGQGFHLDDQGRHHWMPLAPRCRLDVRMEAPARSWQGEGYLDRNQGAIPLEDDFAYWDWSRAALADRTTILYDAQRRDGSARSIALDVDGKGGVTEFDPPARRSLPNNRWRVPRSTQTNGEANIIETLEDTPFYSRSILQTELSGQTVTAMHESLSLDRFRQGWVQALLPFRMPRRDWPLPR